MLPSKVTSLDDSGHHYQTWNRTISASRPLLAEHLDRLKVLCQSVPRTIYLKQQGELTSIPELCFKRNAREQGISRDCRRLCRTKSLRERRALI